jgi:hypothetical protein
MRVYRDGRGICVVARRTIGVTLLVAIALINSSRGVADESPGIVSEKQTLPQSKAAGASTTQTQQSGSALKVRCLSRSILLKTGASQIYQ